MNLSILTKTTEKGFALDDFERISVEELSLKSLGDQGCHQCQPVESSFDPLEICIYSLLTLLLQWVICRKRQIRGRLREQRTRKGTNLCINALLSSGSANDLPFHSIFLLGNWKNAFTGLWHIAVSLQGQASEVHTCTLAKLCSPEQRGGGKTFWNIPNCLEHTMC